MAAVVITTLNLTVTLAFRLVTVIVQADIIKVFAAAQAAAPTVVFIDDADIVTRNQ